MSLASIFGSAILPIVALALVGFENSVDRVFVLKGAMPTAVPTLILTGEFAGPTEGDLATTDYASTTIFVPTVLSVPLLTATIAVF